MGAITTLEKIIITPLKRINVPGGDVMHAMKNTDIGYDAFGEAYFSWVMPGAVKAWKLHTIMTLNLIVPVGEVKFVFISPENINDHREVYIGSSNYARLTVPPGIWFGFQGKGVTDSLVLNIASILHNPSESIREELSFLTYDWKIQS